MGRVDDIRLIRGGIFVGSVLLSFEDHGLS